MRITDDFRNKDKMVSDMKHRIERDLVNQTRMHTQTPTAYKTAPLSPRASSNRPSLIGGERQTLADERTPYIRNMTESPLPKQRDTINPLAESLSQPSLSPLIRPRKRPGAQLVDYVYLSSFDLSQNDRDANRALAQNLNYMTVDKVEQCLQYARSYILSEMPQWLLTKYVDSLERLTEVSVNYGITLSPEEIYLGRDGFVNRDIMLDSVLQVFQTGGRDQRNKVMTVDQFISFVSSELNYKNFARIQSRPMTPQEKQLADEAHSACRHHADLQSVFSNIQRASMKYTGLEAYVIWRLAQLIDNPRSYEHAIILPENQLKFVTNSGLDNDGKICNILPSDSEIVAAVFTGLMDLSSLCLQHPRHLYDYSYSSKLKHVIPEKMPDRNVKKYVAALINTQPVHALSSQQQCVPHFEVIRGDERIPMPAGENNIFYCIMVAFVHIVKEHKKTSINAYGPADHQSFEMRYGDYDWIDAINFIFSADGKGNGGPLHSNLLRNDYSNY